MRCVVAVNLVAIEVLQNNIVGKCQVEDFQDSIREVCGLDELAFLCDAKTEVVDCRVLSGCRPVTWVGIA